MIEIKSRERAVEVRRAALADDQRAFKKRKATASRSGAPDTGGEEMDELDMVGQL
jgi:hypothetical protein